MLLKATAGYTYYLKVVCFYLQNIFQYVLNVAGFSEEQSFNEFTAQQLHVLESIIISQKSKSHIDDKAVSFQIPTSSGFIFIDS